MIIKSLDNFAAPYKAILFDLDDTLVDFRQAERQSLALVFEAFFEKYISKAEFDAAYHGINKSLWSAFEQGQLPLGVIGKNRFEMISQQLGAQIHIDDIAEYHETKLGELSDWLPGAEEAILRLHQHYKIGIVTNGFTRVQRLKYKKLCVGEWCKSYIISEEVGSFKPDKAIFMTALNEIKESPKDVLMVGDSINSDFKGALNAGLDFCWVNVDSKEHPEGLPIPKYVVRSVTELLVLLGSFN